MSSEIPLIPPTDDDFAPAPPRPAMTREEADELVRPGFKRRLICWLVDMALLAAVGVAVQHLVFGVEFPDVTVPEAMVPEPEAPAAVAAAELAEFNTEFVVNVVIAFLYFGVMHGRFGGSVGKLLGRFRVRRESDGGRIGYGTAFARAFWSTGILGVLEIPRFLSPGGGWAFLSDVGALYILFNCLCLVWDMKYHRALHDRLAGTRVVMGTTTE